MREHLHDCDGTSQPVCAVTGATGYVGSRIASWLAADCEVVAVGRRPGTEGIGWSLESADISAELRARQAQVLVHCAWDFGQVRASENYRTNVEGTRRLIRSAQLAGVRQIIFISSLSSFEGARSEYGRSKYAVEAIVLAAGGTVIRPGLVWGSRPGGVFGALAKQVEHGGWVPMIGSGRYPQFLVHEDDVAEMVRRVIRCDSGVAPNDRVLSAAHPHPWPLRDLLLFLAARENKKVKLIGVPWRLVYVGLKLAETFGIPSDFRSDSLLGLVYGLRDLSTTGEFGLRPFTQ